MAHVRASGPRIVSRVRRIQGQLEAIIRALEAEDDCFKVLQTAAACRGALNGLINDLMEDHLDSHLKNAKSLKTVSQETEKLKRLLRSYVL